MGGAEAGTELFVPPLWWAVINCQLEPVLEDNVCAGDIPSIQTLACSVGVGPCLGLAGGSHCSLPASVEKKLQGKGEVAFP